MEAADIDPAAVSEQESSPVSREDRREDATPGTGFDLWHPDDATVDGPVGCRTMAKDCMEAQASANRQDRHSFEHRSVMVSHSSARRS